MGSNGDDAAVDERAETGGPPSAAALATASLDAMPAAVLVVDDDDTVVYGTEEWAGPETPDAVVGTAVGDWFADADAAALSEAIAAVRAGERERATHEVGSWAGDPEWTEIELRPLAHDGERYALLAARDVTARKRTERALERRTVGLDRATAVLTEITALIEALSTVESRDSLTTEICERLVATERYDLAWTATTDLSGRVSVGACAGECEGVLAAGGTSTDSVVGDRIAGIRREAAVCRDDADPFWGVVDEDPDRAYLAVPMAFAASNYGALVVHAATPSAFGEWERAAFAVLGRLLGYALHRVERGDLLHGSDATELRLRTGSEDSALAALSERTGATVTMQGLVSGGDGTALLYLTVEGADADAVEAACDGIAGIADVTVVASGADGCTVECTVADHSPLLAMLDRGGAVQTATAADGVVEWTVHVATTADAADVVGSLMATHPTTTLEAKRRVERSVTTLAGYWEQLDDDLTDRQRSILQAAYYAGYFEWPREVDGETVADSFGITSPTFHEHMRAALSKLMRTLFENRT